MFNSRHWCTATLVVLAAMVLSSATLAQQSDPNTELVQKWLGSPHADSSSPSFTHWDDAGEIPPNCALCHSGEGFRAFYGLGGSATGPIDHPVPTGGVVDCATCHEEGVDEIASVTFPSGASVTPQGSTATCTTCHQGRASGAQIAGATEQMADDEVNPELGFINPHYAVAAATQLGAEVTGGYEYPDQDYMGRFDHVSPFSTCVDCHDPHSLEVELENCVGCHQVDELRAIRTSTADFDGDGDTASGIYAEIAALQTRLLEAIQQYATDIAGMPIVYADHYPYFLVAENGATSGEPYTSWTPALLRAAYNYQFVLKDEGAYAHNPHYAIQLLHDSINDLAARTGMDAGLGARP